MARKILTQDIEKTVINSQTGEILQTTSQRTFTTNIKSESFYMTFIDYIAPLYELKSNSLKNLLTYLCEHEEFNTGKVSLTTAARKVACDYLGISNNTLTNYLKKLKDSNLISGKDGEFIINPQIFWKGDTKSRAQILENEEIKITFNIG